MKQNNNPDYELSGASQTPVEGNLRALAALFPSVVREGKVDFDALKQCLGEDNLAEPGTAFGLQWFGKQEARNAANIASLGTLRPCREDSVDWDSTGNIYIEGDNLEVLRLLQRSYHGRVKMIYIDPPYNTGKDFVYKDNFRDGLRAYQKLTDNGDFSANQNSDGRYHSNWLSMMYPRLVLARELLTEDGVIFVSIDDHELPNLRNICDEIYGEENFVGCFLWRKKSTSTNVRNALVSAQTDYQLCYAKRPLSTCLSRRETSVEERVYPYQDERGVFRLVTIEKKNSGEYERATMQFPILGVLPRPGKRWQIGELTARQYEKDDLFVVADGVVKLKIYKDSDKTTYSANPGLLLDSLLGIRANENDYFDVGYLFDCGGTDSAATETNVELLGREELFSNPKPVKLIKHLMLMGSQDESIILDFFSGSATTAHAVMQLNAEDGGHRRFIMVQLPETCPADSVAAQAGYKTICDIGKERIRRAGTKIRAEHPEWEGDTGFRVYKLDGSNLRRWNPAVAELQEALPGFVDHLVPGRSSDDLLAELLLKRGLDLCSPSETLRTAAGSEIHCFGYGDSYVCLAEQLSPQEAEAVACLMVEHKLGVDPNGENSCAILLDAAFCGDDAAKLNLVTALKQQGNFMKVNFI